MSTTKLSIMDTIKNMGDSAQVPVANRKSVKDINPLKGTPHTSKDKAVLGIDEERIIVWAYPNFDHTSSDKFKIIAKAANMTTADLAARIVMDWFDKNIEEIDEITVSQLKAANTVDDIQKKLDAGARQLAKLQELMAKMKGTTE